MNKQTIIALVLISLIFILWDDYLKLVGLGPTEQPLIEETTSSPSNGDPNQGRQYTPDEKGHGSIINDNVILSESIAENNGKLDIDLTTPDELEQYITVETETFRARLTTYGAGLTSYIIKPVQIYINEEVELIPRGGRPRPFYRFWTYDGPIDTDKLKFRFAENSFSNGSVIKVDSG